MTRYFKFLVVGFLLSLLMILGGTYWIGIRLTNPAPATIGAPPPFLPAQSVRFPNPRGKSLSGWYLLGRQECGSIILMHAVRSNRLSMVKRARFLHKAGYSVLLFDFQAHGESRGETITFGSLEKEDARAAVQFVAQRHSEAPIGIIGFSLGGAASVLNGPALGADALVLEAVYSTFEHAVTNRIHMHMSFLAPLLAYPAILHLQHYYGIDPQELRPIDTISSIGIPVFVIGGTHDQHTLQSETQDLFSIASSPKELWLVQGAHHQNFHRYAPTDYEAKVLEFLNTHVGCISTITKESP